MTTPAEDFDTAKRVAALRRRSIEAMDKELAETGRVTEHKLCPICGDQPPPPPQREAP